MARRGQRKNELLQALSKSKTLRNVLEKAARVGNEISPALASELKEAFSPSSLSSVFIHESSRTKRKNASLDKGMMEQSFSTLKDRPDLCKKIAEIILELYDDLGSILCDESKSLRMLRIVPILISCPVLNYPNEMWSRRVVLIVCNGLRKLNEDKPDRFNVLVTWLKMDEDMFRQTLNVFKIHLSTRLDEDVDVLNLLQPLSFLNMVNESQHIVPNKDFYIPNMPDTYTRWHLLHIGIFLDNKSEASNSNQGRFTWLDFPFMLNTVSKWIFLQLEMLIHTLTLKQMPIPQNDWMTSLLAGVNSSVSQNLDGHSGPVAALNQLFQGLGLIEQQQDQLMIGTADRPIQNVLNQLLQGFQQHIPQQYVSVCVMKEPLIFEVDRSHIVETAMDNVRKYRQIEGTNEKAWSKKKVWLRPLQVNFKGEYAIDLGGPSKEFFYLLFMELTQTDKYNYFTRDNCGNICFNEEVKPDQREDMEALGILFSLMIYNRAIVTVAFPAKVYEGLLSINCPPSPVNAFDFFRRGFDRCFKHLHIHRLFRPDEFRDLILGGELNWKSFEKHTLYKSPYNKDNEVVEMFWRVFHSLHEEERKAFYRFQTCAEYVPIQGFKSLDYTIRRLDTQTVYGAEAKLIMPEIDSCPGFLRMDLPEYMTEEDLKERLLLAISAEGFHREAPPQGPYMQTARFPVTIKNDLLQSAIITSPVYWYGGSLQTDRFFSLE